MSTTIAKIFSAAAIVLSLGAVGAPVATAATPAPEPAAADPVVGSVFICFNLGSATVCI